MNSRTMSNWPRTHHIFWGALAALVVLSSTGCTMIGPDYVRPPAPTAADWIETNEPAVKREPADVSAWWTVFNDQVLNTLVETAYQQNPSLRAAGVRVLEAQAQRGIAIGQLFPQQQDAFGNYSRNDLSENKANRNTPNLKTPFDDWQVGFEATWELDVWGRFRRAIESADATLLASVATYNDVLVSLVAEVATNYLQLRIFQERLAVAHANVVIQERSYYIANAKFQGGTATELDAAQAASLLRDTEAQIPALETGIRQTQNSRPTCCVAAPIFAKLNGRWPLKVRRSDSPRQICCRALLCSAPLASAPNTSPICSRPTASKTSEARAFAGPS